MLRAQARTFSVGVYTAFYFDFGNNKPHHNNNKRKHYYEHEIPATKHGKRPAPAQGHFGVDVYEC